MSADPKIRIAVSGTGGGVGQSILKSLYGTGYEVIALDGEVLGAGLYASAKSYVIPYASDPKYVDAVLDICKKEGCKVFFPGLDAELLPLSEASERFEQNGIKVIVSRPEVISISNDKMLTYTTFSKYGINVPLTVDMEDHLQNGTALPSFPFILKQKVGGARSQNVFLIKDEEKLKSLEASGVDFGQFVAQEYIEGDEYTCGSVNLDGKCHGVIVMRRILRDGDTYKCFSVKDETIEKEVRKVLDAIKPFGGCNVQLRVKDGVPHIFEINARCSGTTGARSLCGFNEPKMIADYICYGKAPTYEIKEQTILRYWKELVVPNDFVETVKKDGTITNPEFTQL